MKNRYLLPHFFKIIGWILTVPGLIAGYFVLFRQYKILGFGPADLHKSLSFPENTYTDELVLTVVVFGTIFLAFAKEKKEDELTCKIRQNALYWAILINYLICIILLLAAFIKGFFFYDFHNFLELFGYEIVISQYNLFTPLIIFVLRYYYLLYIKADEYKIGKLSYLSYKPYRLIAKCISLALIIGFILIYTIKWLSNDTLDFRRAVDPMFVCLMLSLLGWLYSHEKKEDELINNVRLESMQLAVYFNYAILLVANLTLFSGWFLFFMFMNLITIEIFFLIRFYYSLWKLNKEAGELLS